MHPFGPLSSIPNFTSTSFFSSRSTSNRLPQPGVLEGRRCHLLMRIHYMIGCICQLACGSRSWSYLPRGLSVAPDGNVFLHFWNSPLLVSCPLSYPSHGLQSGQTKTVMPPGHPSAYQLQWLSITFRIESGLLSLVTVTLHDMRLVCFLHLFICFPISSFAPPLSTLVRQFPLARGGLLVVPQDLCIC